MTPGRAPRVTQAHPPHLTTPDGGAKPLSRGRRHTHRGWGPAPGHLSLADGDSESMEAHWRSVPGTLEKQTLGGPYNRALYWTRRPTTDQTESPPNDHVGETSDVQAGGRSACSARLTLEPHGFGLRAHAHTHCPKFTCRVQPRAVPGPPPWLDVLACRGPTRVTREFWGGRKGRHPNPRLVQGQLQKMRSST